MNLSGPGRLMVELRFLVISGDRERAGEHNVKQLRAGSWGRSTALQGRLTGKELSAKL